MKHLSFILLAVILFISCEKESEKEIVYINTEPHIYQVHYYGYADKQGIFYYTIKDETMHYYYDGYNNNYFDEYFPSEGGYLLTISFNPEYAVYPGDKFVVRIYVDNILVAGDSTSFYTVNEEIIAEYLLKL